MTKRELIERAFEENPYFCRQDFAQKNDIHERYVFKIIKKLREERGISRMQPGFRDKKESQSDKAAVNYEKNAAYLEMTSREIKTAEDACKYAEVDMATWMVDRQIVSFWDVTMKLVDNKGKESSKTVRNYHIKVWLNRRTDKVVIDAIDRFINRVPKFKFHYFKPIHLQSASKCAGEVAMLDAHMGKLAWAAETQQKDYDLGLSQENYKYALDKNLEWMAPFRPEKIFYILGQDLMHIENLEGTTPRGHNILDSDTRLDKVIDMAIDITVKSIYRCRSQAPVEVILIPGNHDMHSSKWLARCIDRHFRKDKHVSVDFGPNNRKARLWGKTLVGWCHEIPPSKAAVYANEMAQTFRKEWARAIYVEWHYGHKHKKNEIKTSPVITHGGALMRQLTALSPIDFWHYENVLTDAVPGGESFVWHKDLGVVANFVAWTKHV